MDSLQAFDGPRLEPVYELPDLAETRDGFVYCPKGDDWQILTNTERLNFHFGGIGLSSALKSHFKLFIVARLRSKNPLSVHGYYQWARQLLLHVGSNDPAATEISSTHLLNYRASLKREQLYLSTSANDAVRAWARLGIPGVPRATFCTAKDMPRYTKKKSLAVRLRCPIQGAYTNLEYEGLYKALHVGFSKGDISLDNYALCLLSGAICPRPIQLASLRVCDLKVTHASAGSTYILSVPRAKQRGGGYRIQFTDRPLVEEIGLVVEAQARFIREQARAGDMSDPDQAPLFPALHTNSIFSGGGSVLTRPTKAAISARIRIVMEGLGVRSERTGEVINSNATRARRTAGTRAAQEGRSLEEIAAVLDHTSLTAAHNYVEICSELLQNLDKKIAILLAPMAQRFAGSITGRGADQEHSIERHVFGTTNNDSAAPADIGGCGKHGYCGLGKPIACYTCRLFHPWLDGPHEAVLDGLLARRKRMAADGDPIVAASLDDTIIACAEVVRQCGIRIALIADNSDG